MEQLQKHEDLKQKLMGGGDNSSDDEVLSKEAARDQLLEMKLDAANQEIPVKGLMAMKFMQKHVQDQKDSVLNATKRALLDLESENDTGIDENEHTDTFDVTNEKQVYSDDEQLNTKYFQKFNDEKSSGHERHEEFKLNPDELLNVREKRVLPVVIVDDEVSVSSDDERNPWLQELSVPTQRSKTFKKEIVHTPVIIQSIQPTQTIAISEEESDLDSDKDEVVDHALSKKQVLEMAFGIDEVAEGFESSDVDDKKEDALLGWGSWSNQKTKIKKTKEELVKKVLKRVVIHGKMPKSLKPYLVGSVPHGYENKAQYERTMRMGLGREWNTAAVYQKRIKPRLSMKPGQVILPMK